MLGTVKQAPSLAKVMLLSQRIGESSCLSARVLYESGVRSEGIAYPQQPNCEWDSHPYQHDSPLAFRCQPNS